MRYVLVLASLVGLLAACSDAAAGPAVAEGPQLLAADAAVDLLAEEEVVIIDVRTPEEFADGHLAGAELFDIQASDFEQRIAALDPDATYVVYCRTGNRSANAVQAMADIGIGTLYDAGGFAELAAAGAPVAER